MQQDDELKPKRLYFKTYLQMIRNSVGTNMFRNFYIKSADGVEADAMANGDTACAFYVSSILTLFKKVAGVHGTVAKTVEELEQSGWLHVATPKAGDVIVWEKIDLSGTNSSHIGFAVSEDRAISTSSTQKTVVEHDIHFGEAKRAIQCIYRISNWDD